MGPIRFGQSREEVSAALEEPIMAWDTKRYARWFPFDGVGIDTYYDQETQTLAAVAVDACRGPQVSLDGVPLVGRLPSELEPWIEKTASTLEDPTLPEYVDGLRFGPAGSRISSAWDWSCAASRTETTPAVARCSLRLSGPREVRNGSRT
ncbi:hypothetical protein SHKM778_27800 [Streptomyces sp. KM77-8]|uniref:Uncharacterized protein n=1 Tax=Streptomyces haneummycinicus TaxID=3074435 RepID=A0AAT9HG96_9ACTN